MKIIIEDDTCTHAKEYTNLSTEIVNAVTTLLELIVDNPLSDYDTDWSYELSNNEE